MKVIEYCAVSCSNFCKEKKVHFSLESLKLGNPKQGLSINEEQFTILVNSPRQFEIVPGGAFTNLFVFRGGSEICYIYYSRSENLGTWVVKKC